VKRLILFAALLLFVPSVAAGKRAPGNTPVVSAATSPYVLIGTVTEIDKDPVELTSAPGTKDKQSLSVATVKVSAAIRGLKSETHIKVAFQPGIRSGQHLVEKQEYLLFLNKHHDGNFYVMNWMNAPQPVTDANREVVDRVKAIGKVLSDPAKALKAEKAEDKAIAAYALAMNYRNPTEPGAAQSTEAVPLAESQAILKAAAGIDWGEHPTLGGFETIRIIYQLALTEKDGWRQPAFKPGENAGAAMHKAFAEWLAGPGAKYQIQKFVAKKK
jgi:hypothetical protein